MPVERIGVNTKEAVKLRDNAELRFGNGAQAMDWDVGDVYIRWDGTDLDMVPTANNTVFKIGASSYSFDVWLYGSTTSYYWLWDASANTLYGSGGVALVLNDNSAVKFGNSSDVSITWDATNLVITAAADDSVIEIGDAAITQASFDVKFYGNTSTGYMLWDASADRLLFSGGTGLVPNKNATFTSGTAVGAIPVTVSNTAGFLLVYSTV